MSHLLAFVHAISGLVVLAEALNKLERTRVLDVRGHDLLVEALKALAWLLLALGAGGAVAGPLLLAMGVPPNAGGTLLRLNEHTLAETLVLLGFAVLIVRTRVKEG